MFRQFENSSVEKYAIYAVIWRYSFSANFILSGALSYGLTYLLVVCLGPDFIGPNTIIITLPALGIFFYGVFQLYLYKVMRNRLFEETQQSSPDDAADQVKQSDSTGSSALESVEPAIGDYSDVDGGLDESYAHDTDSVRFPQREFDLDQTRVTTGTNEEPPLIDDSQINPMDMIDDFHPNWDHYPEDQRHD